MDGLCETVEVKSNKIIDLKLKLKRYETNKNNQTEMKTRDYVLSNKMVNYFKSKFFILNYCLNQLNQKSSHKKIENDYESDSNESSQYTKVKKNCYFF